MSKSKKKKGSFKVSIITGVLAFVVLIGIIYLCVRPVSVGFAYTRKDVVPSLTGKNETITTEYKFDTFRKGKLKASREGGNSTTETFYYFEHEGLIVELEDLDGEMTSDQYKERKDAKLKNWDIVKKTGIKINAFTVGEGEDKAVCIGAIVSVSVLAVIEIALIASTVILLVKKKK